MAQITQNSDKSLLVTVGEPDFDFKDFSRREFIRLGVMTTTVMTITPIALFTQEAKASPTWLPWLFWTGRPAFAAAISWLVNRALDKAFPENDPEVADKLNVQVITPRSTNDSFHNIHADPYIVANPRYNFDTEYSKKCRYYIELNRYLRSDEENPIADFKDLSTSEIKRLAYEDKYYKNILFPCGLRERPNRDHYAGYRSTCNAYKVDPDLLELEYVRPFNDGRDSCLTYGVKSRQTGRKDLLIS